MGVMQRIRAIFGQGGALGDAGEALARQLAERGGAASLGLSPRGVGAFDRVMDALNRLPRPLMALGIIAMLTAAVIDPVWFAARMEALAAMPEAAWWLIGGLLSLYFGGRFQAHDQAFQREVLEAMARLNAEKTATEGPAKPM
jgi:hypothetical protein